MSKRNKVSYVKPQDPSFLKRLKEQIGYKESDSIETKRQKFEEKSSSTSDEEVGGSHSDADDSFGTGIAGKEDEKPQVVVLKTGDLTAAEADEEQRRIEKAEATKPADLNKRIIFKAKKVKIVDETTINNKKDKVKNSKLNELKSKLSFNNDEDEFNLDQE